MVTMSRSFLRAVTSQGVSGSQYTNTRKYKLSLTLIYRDGPFSNVLPSICLSCCLRQTCMNNKVASARFYVGEQVFDKNPLQGGLWDIYVSSKSGFYIFDLSGGHKMRGKMSRLPGFFHVSLSLFLIIAHPVLCLKKTNPNR